MKGRSKALTIVVSFLIMGLNPVAASATGSPVIVSGTVVDGSGVALPNVTVQLFYASQMTTQDSVASTTTDSAGAFSIGMDDTRGFQATWISNGGYANLDLAVSSGTLFFVKGISRQWASGAWVDQDGAAPAPEVVVLASSQPGVSPIPLRAGAQQRAVTCTPQKSLMSTSDAWTDVGEFHAANDAMGFFRYGKTADSDIGIGVSANGSIWSLSGSVHVANSNSSVIQFNRGPKYGRRESTVFHYGKYKWVNCGQIISYEVDALQWTSGAQDGQDNSSYDYHCTTTYSAYARSFGLNTSFERSSNAAVTFNAAASVFGVGLTVKSGYSTYVVAHWNFGNSASQHWLCGDTNYITSSQRIFAGA